MTAHQAAGPAPGRSRAFLEPTGAPGAGPPHPRRLGWIGTTALAMGGSNQSLFIIGAIIVSQGTAAVPLLIVGLLLSWAAAPGWIELVLMWPNRVGGIAASCADAFRPYSPVLANLAGVCYWWGWVPTCGLTAILSASALHEWYLHAIPVHVLAIAIVLMFTAVNLCGIRWVTRLAVPLAAASAALAFLSALIPVLSGHVDWHRAASITLHAPFHGVFGHLTSAMAGLYLIGFAAPAFEAAACHVGETRDPARNVPRAMFASGAMASVYFIVLPIIWLGTIGRGGLSGQLIDTLGPTFAPLLGAGAKSAAIAFMVFNMFHGTLQPLAGASRTLSQLSEDGLLPRLLARRSARDVPVVATLLTAGMSILFLLAGDPTWLIAAANLTYLIGIGLPSIAVWLLRRNAPGLPRPYRAPRGTIGLGVAAAMVWALSTVFGFEQYGLPTVLFGLALAYAGSTLYAWRAWRDRVACGATRIRRSLHFKLTGAMLAVMALDGAGYLLAVENVHRAEAWLTTVLSDIFVAVALLTIAVGLILPGMIAHATREVAAGALGLANGMVSDLTRAMEALNAGDLDAAHASAAIAPVAVRSRDELGLMAESFNVMQAGVARIAVALDDAREGMRASAAVLERNVAQQAAVARLGQRALEPGGVQELLRDAVTALREVMRVDVAAILQSDTDPRFLRLRAVAGLMPGRPIPELICPESGALHASLGSRQPVAAPLGDAGLLAPYLPVAPASSLLMPIHAGPAVWGVLSVDSVRGRVFSQDEVDFVHAVGNVLTEAIGRKRSVAEIRHQALHDPLTGLPNRVMFVDRLTVALGRATRADTAVAVLFLDLDNFKLINDSLGHSAGDEVLGRVARRMTEVLRPGDTVARFGGDEFVIICTDLPTPEDAEAVAARAIARLNQPLRIGEIDYHLSGSIGIATASGVARDAEDLIREADAAMYRAKERGRNRCERFDEEMRSQAVSRLSMANDLAVALELGELRVDYQPIVTLADGTVRGFEALVRWHHAKRGEISPGEFIGVAEESGAILGIGEFVLRQACRDAMSWQPAGAGGRPLAVSVNVSLRQVAHGNLPELVAAVLAETGLDPACLHLEITESVLMRDTEMSLACLHALKGLGVTLVLDDFGTGYSSLAYVKRFPIDIIKIDRGFIADLARDDRDAKIVEAVVYMARGLRLEVVAEGVETVAQAEALNELHCEMAQGWLYARAVRAEAVGDLLGGPLGPRAESDLLSA